MTTQAAFDKWAGKGKDGTLLDQGQAGLSYRMRAGKIAGVVQARVGGRVLTRSIGPVVDIATARVLAREKLAEIEKADTIGDIVVRYVEENRDRLKPKTIIDYEVLIRKHLGRLGGLVPDQLTVKAVREWYAGVVESSPASANKAASLIQVALAEAEVVNVISLALRRRRVRLSPRDRVIPPDRLGVAVAVLHQYLTFGRTVTLRSQAAVLLCQLYLGSRFAEIAGLKVGEVDVGNRAIVLQPARTKTKSRLVRPIPGTIWGMIEPAIDGKCDADLVFPGRGGERLSSCRYMARVLSGEILATVSSHDLRRTAYSTMTMLGLPEVAVSALVGHSTPGVKAHYQVLSVEWLRVHSDRLGDHLDDAHRGAVESNPQLGVEPGRP